MPVRLICLLCLMGSACAPRPPEPCVEPDAAWIDRDQDGFPERFDCNDDHKGIHPEAFEQCDRIDNNCDGTKDEIYTDYDGDGRPDCEANELCDGVDNDLDGRIDEGFEDFDGDGVADCLDNMCTTEPTLGGEVDVDEDCTGPDIKVIDPWNLKIEWQYKSPTNGSIVMPAIGNLTDDNSDGLINDADNPDIVFTEWSGRSLVALHGDGSGEIFRITGINGLAGVTIADIDSDGEPEIVTMNASRQAVLYSASGKVEWTSAALTGLGNYPQPAVADLDGDGDVEVVMDNNIIDGKTGRVQATITHTTTRYTTPAIADLDADGTSEILLGNGVYDHNGKLEWSVPAAGSLTGFGGAVDIDGDAGGESVWVFRSLMVVMDDDGTELSRTTLPSTGWSGPHAIADFDGDGDVEVAVPTGTMLHVVETSGKVLWSSPMRDFSGYAGASGYDVDGDGKYEVLFADETHFRMYDGATGKVLYENGKHSSGTVAEYPTVADVDGDGSAEVVIVSNGTGWNGVTVFGHDGPGWAAAGPTWGTHDFCVTNLNSDGSVPTPAPLPWTVHNVFRARPVVDSVATDLTVEIVDVCVSGCQPGVGTLQAQVQVSNVGDSGAYRDVPVSLYSLDGGTRTLLGTVTVGGGIDGGTSADSVVFTVPIEQVGPDGLLVRVDDDGSLPDEEYGKGLISECNEENNTDDWPYQVCGP